MSKKIFVVTWTNHVVGQIGPEDIKCFEDYNTARHLQNSCAMIIIM